VRAIYDDIMVTRQTDRISNVWKALAGDPVLSRVLPHTAGISLLAQDPWETLISFIISQNNNIPKIMGSIDRLARAAGEPLGDGVFAFPRPERLAAARIRLDPGLVGDHERDRGPIFLLEGQARPARGQEKCVAPPSSEEFDLRVRLTFIDLETQWKPGQQVSNPLLRGRRQGLRPAGEGGGGRSLRRVRGQMCRRMRDGYRSRGEHYYDHEQSAV
jgi:hypothetical protein